MSRRVPLLALLLLGVAHGTARAQDLMGSITNANLMANFHNASAMVSGSMLDAIEEPPRLGAGSALPPPLTFSAPDAVRGGLHEAVARDLAQGHRPTEQAILRELASGAPQREFHRILQDNRFDPQDLGDVMTAYVYFMWQIVHDELELRRDPATIAAVRAQLSPRFRASPALSSLDEQTRAREAERLIALSMFGAAALIQRKQIGDTAGALELRDAVHAGMLRSGIDLRALALTESGFSKVE